MIVYFALQIMVNESIHHLRFHKVLNMLEIACFLGVFCKQVILFIREILLQDCGRYMSIFLRIRCGMGVEHEW